MVRRLGAVLTALALIWVSVAGASGVVVAGGGARAGEESAGRAKVLVIGDSVFTAFDHVPSARRFGVYVGNPIRKISARDI